MRSLEELEALASGVPLSQPVAHPVVAAARKRVGEECGPNGCARFTSRVLKDAGYDFDSASSSELRRMILARGGQEVTDLQPGDLFFYTGGKTGYKHVGVVGDGEIIDSPGRRTKYRSVSRKGGPRAPHVGLRLPESAARQSKLTTLADKPGPSRAENQKLIGEVFGDSQPRQRSLAELEALAAGTPSPQAKPARSLAELEALAAGVPAAARGEVIRPQDVPASGQWAFAPARGSAIEPGAPGSIAQGPPRPGPGHPASLQQGPPRPASAVQRPTPYTPRTPPEVKQVKEPRQPASRVRHPLAFNFSDWSTNAKPIDEGLGGTLESWFGATGRARRQEAIEAVRRAQESGKRVAPPVLSKAPDRNAQELAGLQQVRPAYAKVKGDAEWALRQQFKPKLDALDRRLASLRDSYGRRLTGYGADDPETQRLEAQLEAVQQQYADTFVQVGGILEKRLTAGSIEKQLGRKLTPIEKHAVRAAASADAGLLEYTPKIQMGYGLDVIIGLGSEVAGGVLGGPAAGLAQQGARRAGAPIVQKLATTKGGQAAQKALTEGTKAGARRRAVAGIAQKVAGVTPEGASVAIASGLQQAGTYAASDPDPTLAGFVMEGLKGAAAGKLFDAGFKLTGVGWRYLRGAVARNGKSVQVVQKALEDLAGGNVNGQPGVTFERPRTTQGVPSGVGPKRPVQGLTLGEAAGITLPSPAKPVAQAGARALDEKTTQRPPDMPAVSARPAEVPTPGPSVPDVFDEILKATAPPKPTDQIAPATPDPAPTPEVPVSGQKEPWRMRRMAWQDEAIDRYRILDAEERGDGRQYAGTVRQLIRDPELLKQLGEDTLNTPVFVDDLPQGTGAAARSRELTPAQKASGVPSGADIVLRRATLTPFDDLTHEIIHIERANRGRLMPKDAPYSERPQEISAQKAVEHFTRGTHRRAVEQALRDGKPVPSEVLADYPDLAAQAPPAAATVPTPATAFPAPKPEVTGLANRVQEEEALAGIIRDPEKGLAQNSEHFQKRGKELVDAGDADPEQLAREIATGQKGITADDFGVMLEGKRQLENAMRLARKKLDDAVQAGSGDVPGLRKSYEAAQEKLNTYLDDVQKGKGEWSNIGRALQAGTTLNEGDFAQVLPEARRAKGRKLDAAEEAKFQALSDQIKVHEEEIAKQATELKRLEAEAVGQQATKRGKRAPSEKRARIQADRAAIIEEIKALAGEVAGKTHDIGSAVYDAGRMAVPVGRLAISYMREGVAVLEEVVAKVRADLSKHGLELTDDDVIDAIVKASSTGPRVRTVAGKLKSEARRDVELREQITNLKAGLPNETPERQKITNARIEALEQERDTLLQSAEGQDRAAQQRVRQQIEDLKSGEASAKREERPASPELQALRDERDALRAAQRKTAQAEAQKTAAANARQKRIDALNQQIEALKKGEVPTQTAKAPGKPDPEIEKLVGERDALLKQLRKAKSDATRPTREAAAAATAQKKRIGELTAQINRLKKGEALPAPARSTKPVNPAVAKLTSERDELLKAQRKAASEATRPEREAKAAAKRQAKQIEELNKQIETLERGEELGKRPKPAGDPATKPLRERRDELVREAAAQKKIADLEAQLDDLPERKADLEKRIQELKAAARTDPFVKPELDELQRRLREGEFFEPSTRKAREVSRKLADARAKRDLLAAEVRQRIEALKPKTTVQKITGTLGAAKSTASSLDISAAGRQGLLLGLANPDRAAVAFGKQLQAMGRAESAHRIQASILERPNAPLYQRADLYLAPLEGSSIGRGEEAFAGQLFPGWRKLNPFRGSERAYVVYLNQLRADVFDRMVKGLGEANPSEAQLRQIADFINVATGRGSKGSRQFQNAANTLNHFMFSPRFVASRFQYALGTPLWNAAATPGSRRVIAGQYARTLIALGAILTTAKGAGLLASEDPTSTDFFKIKVGDRRIDPLGGLQQSIVFMARQILGKKTSPITGTTKEMNTGEFGAPTRQDEMLRFLRSKASPAAGALWNLAAREGPLSLENVGSDYLGQRQAVWDLALNMYGPITVKEIIDEAVKDGVDRDDFLGLLNVVGLSSSKYDPMNVDAKQVPRPQYSAVNEVMRKAGATFPEVKPRITSYNPKKKGDPQKIKPVEIPPRVYGRYRQEVSRDWYTALEALSRDPDFLAKDQDGQKSEIKKTLEQVQRVAQDRMLIQKLKINPEYVAK